LENGDCRILIDAGLGIRSLVERLARLDRKPHELTAIFVTHEHSDHARGVKPLSKKYKIPVYGTRGTYESVYKRFGKIPHYHVIEQADEIHLEGLRVESYPTSHDARESVAFVVRSHDRKLGIATDLGQVTPVVREKLSGCDWLYVEANHDEGLLMEGPYPWSLKKRVRSDVGHLSNTACAELLRSVYHSGLQAVTLMHLSEQNNSPEHAVSAVRRALPESVPLHIASQHEVMPLTSLETVVPPPAIVLPRQMEMSF